MRRIVVEIGGDTTKLDKALQTVNKDLRSTQSDLSEINRLLKLDPKNVTLLAQKQKSLTDAVAATQKKLDTLRAAADQAEEALRKGAMTGEQYDALEREIIRVEHSLKSLEEQAADTKRKLESMGMSAAEISEKTGSLADKTRGLSVGIAAVGARRVFRILHGRICGVRYGKGRGETTRRGTGDGQGI